MHFVLLADNLNKGNDMKLNPKKIYKSVAKQLEKHQTEIEIALAVIAIGVSAAFVDDEDTPGVNPQVKLIKELEEARDSVAKARKSLEAYAEHNQPTAFGNYLLDPEGF